MTLEKGAANEKYHQRYDAGRQTSEKNKTLLFSRDFNGSEKCGTQDKKIL